MNSSNRLASVSPAAQDAAWRVVYWELTALIKELPGIAQGPASEKLNSVDGRARVMKILDDALEAADKVEQQNKLRDL